MSNALTVLADKMAARFGMVADGEVLDILKATVFKTKDAVPSDSQMTALLIVANQYGLNPWTKEIYAYPDKQNGIVPVVGVDGWSRIINEHPQFDGMEFAYSDETVEHKGKQCHVWVECLIYRKDRSRPTVVREYFSEVARSLSFATPWDTHPNRMHRHKTVIQCARLAFGFAGIYDDDEALRIIESGTIDGETGEIKPGHVAPPQRKSATNGSAQSKAAEDVPFKDKPAGDAKPAGGINAGQVKYLRQKIDSIGLDESGVKTMLERLGIPALDESMTAAHFDTLKSELLASA
jgi:phage recombination protein Bet